MSDSVGLYLNEIGQVPLLNAAEERELSQIIEAGRDAQARIDAGERSVALRRAVRDAAAAKDRFIRANLRLVVSVARRYPLPPTMELLDLVQEGNLGLEHAVDKFDWRKGFKFSTYATFWIRQAIGRALDQKAQPHPAAGRPLGQPPGRAPGRQRRGRRARRRERRAPPAHQPDLARPHRRRRRRLRADGPHRRRQARPEAIVMAREEDAMVTSLLDVLEPRARFAVEARFGLQDGRKQSYREVGDTLGVTAEAARRLVKRAVDAVREKAGAAA